jgi:hypothetical protein
MIAEVAFYIVQEHEQIALDYLTFVASEKVIICTLCCTAVPVTGLDTHLRTCHNVPPKLRLMSKPSMISYLARTDRRCSPTFLYPHLDFVVYTVQRERQSTGIR